MARFQYIQSCSDVTSLLIRGVMEPKHGTEEDGQSARELLVRMAEISDTPKSALMILLLLSSAVVFPEWAPPRLHMTLENRREGGREYTVLEVSTKKGEPPHPLCCSLDIRVRIAEFEPVIEMLKQRTNKLKVERKDIGVAEDVRNGGKRFIAMILLTFEPAEGVRQHVRPFAAQTRTLPPAPPKNPSPPANIGAVLLVQAPAARIARQTTAQSTDLFASIPPESERKNGK
jgi:hypothetical protein